MFISPFTMVLSGATGSGKSQFLVKFLEHVQEMVSPPPQHILYCYGEANAAVLALREKGIEIFNGVPSEKMIKEKGENLLLVLDDLIIDLRTEFLDLLFTRGSHNWNVSCILVTQALFSKNIKTARSNAHYIILMKNPSTQLQTRTLASQLFPGSVPYFLESYRDATEKPFTYFVINMHPKAPDSLRLSTNIFPGEKTSIYMPI